MAFPSSKIMGIVFMKTDVKSMIFYNFLNSCVASAVEEAMHPVYTLSMVHADRASYKHENADGDASLSSA